jgi:hypothetical protein
MQYNALIEHRWPLADLTRHQLEDSSVNFRGLFPGFEGQYGVNRGQLEPLPAEAQQLRWHLCNPFSPGIMPLGMGTMVNLIIADFYAVPAPLRVVDAYHERSIEWIAFTHEALKDSRPMTDWERSAAAEFFWSEFD